MIHHTFSVSMFIDNLSHGRQYQSALAIFIIESHREVNASGQNVLRVAAGSNLGSYVRYNGEQMSSAFTRTKIYFL